MLECVAVRAGENLRVGPPCAAPHGVTDEPEPVDPVDLRPAFVAEPDVDPLGFFLDERGDLVGWSDALDSPAARPLIVRWIARCVRTSVCPLR